MDKIKSIIVTHGEDPDGIISNALLGIRLRSDFKRYFVSYSQLVEFFQQLSQNEEEIKGKNLYFADLNCNDDILFYLQKIAWLAKSVIWLDHHENTHQNLPALERMKIMVVTNLELGVIAFPICSARLVINLFPRIERNDDIFWLSNFAHASDYANECEKCLNIWKDRLATAEKLQAIISFYNYKQDDAALQGLADKLASGKDWYNNGELDDGLQSVLKKYAEESAKAKQNLLVNSSRYDFGSYKFSLYFASGLLYSKDTMHWLLEKLPANITGIIVVFGNPANNVLFFKGFNDSFDAVPFCHYMGGGGRDGNGGFLINTSALITNLSIKAKIIEKLQEFYQ